MLKAFALYMLIDDAKAGFFDLSHGEQGYFSLTQEQLLCSVAGMLKGREGDHGRCFICLLQGLTTCVT